MSKEAKKMNTYIKYTAFLAAVLLVSGALGAAAAYFKVENWDSVFVVLAGLIRRNMALILLVLSAICITYQEVILHRMKKIGAEIPGAEDAEGDRLEFEMEQMGSAGTISSNLFSVLSILVLCTGYSMEYIIDLGKKENVWLLAAFVIFLIGTVYQGYWQMRYVKTIQRAYPEKKGDPTSRRFQEEWLKSCDEAERDVIYQGAYKAYRGISKLLPALAFVAMIAHLLWDTGIMAVVMVCIIWIVMVIIYSRSCVIKKSQQIK
ncbi:DUF3169 family protein [Blautia schinkii]|nr:DUF3169 family protein [Blautia schinkii]